MKVDESLRAWYSSYATLMIIGLSTNWRNSESLLRGYPINETQWQSTRTSNMEGLQKTRSPTSPSHVFSARLYAASRVLSAKVSQRSHWQEGVLVTIGTIIRQHKFVRWHTARIVNSRLNRKPSRHHEAAPNANLSQRHPLVSTSCIGHVIIESRSEEFNLLLQE
jgi:hypothetical protein